MYKKKIYERFINWNQPKLSMRIRINPKSEKMGKLSSLSLMACRWLVLAGADTIITSRSRASPPPPSAATAIPAAAPPPPAVG